MPRGGDAGGGKKGSSVQFSRPQEPSFLRDLKKQVGYKDPVEDMNAKVDNIDFLVLGCGVGKISDSNSCGNNYSFINAFIFRK